MINQLSFWDCVHDDSSFSLGNYCEKYFSLSSTVFRVVRFKNDSFKDESIQPLEKHHFMVVKDQVDQNIFINILKVISYCTIVIPIIMLLGKVLLRNSYTFIDIDELEKEKANETFTLQQKRYREEILFGLSLDKWLSDPNATGNKGGAAKVIWDCFLIRTKVGLLNANAPNGGDTLDLSGYSLNSLPNGMEFFKHVKILILNNNKFTTIPDSVFQIPNLERLDSCFNQISDISKIGNLTNLIQLDLSGNQISDISEIGNLTNLECLSIRCNQLTTLPASISKLTKLKYFYLMGNQLKSIPAEIGNLSDLKILSLNSNDISDIPKEIGNLTNLVELRLVDNKLTTVPVQIGNLTKLVQLHLNHNKLTTVPVQIGNLTKLVELDLRNNKLTMIPVEIGNLIKLKKIYLRFNSDLDQLPSSLGYLENITSLDIEGTRISEENRDGIIESCKNMRKNKEVSNLSAE